MTKTLLAAVLLLSLPSAARAQSDEGEYWMQRAAQEARLEIERAQAAKAAQTAAAQARAQAAAAAKPSGPCAENPGLDGPTGFAFTIEGKNGISMSFLFSGCAADGAKAVRTYHADQAGYSLRVETPAGSSQSSLSVIEHWAGGAPKTAARLGTRDTASLLAQHGADLGPVTLTDTRGDAKTSYKGKASLKAGQYSGGSAEEPRGCQ